MEKMLPLGLLMIKMETNRENDMTKVKAHWMEKVILAFFYERKVFLYYPSCIKHCIQYIAVMQRRWKN